MISVVMSNKGEPTGNSTEVIEGSKVKINDYTLAFKGNTVKVTSKNKNMPKGEYKRVNSYSTKQIYKDNIGNITLFEKNNGVYKNDVTTVYVIKTDENTYRYANSYKNTGINLTATKENDKYISDLVDEKYELIVSNDTIELKIDSQDETAKVIAGKYTKKESIKMADAIKIFMFDSYSEQQ